MHGVAPQMCGQVVRPSLGGGAGGSLHRLHLKHIAALLRRHQQQIEPDLKDNNLSRRMAYDGDRNY